MKLVVCSIFDRKVHAFVAPFFCRTKGEAIRMFTDAVNGKDTNLSNHPEDFDLMYIGEWSDDTAQFELFAPSLLVGASDVLKSE